MVGTPELAVEVTLQPVDILKRGCGDHLQRHPGDPAGDGYELRWTRESGRGSPAASRTGAISTGCAGSGARGAPGLCARGDTAGARARIEGQGAAHRLRRCAVDADELHGGGRRVEELQRRQAAPGGGRSARAHALLDRLARAVGRVPQGAGAAGAQVGAALRLVGRRARPEDFREFCAAVPGEGGPHRARGRGAGDRLRAGCGLGVGGDRAARPVRTWWAWTGRRRRRQPTAGVALFPVALQGNLDPCWLYAPPSESSASARGRCCCAFGGRGHIANLGHGILPDVPVDNARAFVDAVEEWTSA